MGWANARRRTVVDFEPDPNGSYALALSRAIWRRVQGVGLHSVVGFDGSPERSYTGSYADQLQARPGSTTEVATRSVYRDMGAADVSNGVTAPGSAAAQQFAARLRRGRVLS